MLLDTGNIYSTRRRADVDRKEIVKHGRSRCADDAPGIGIDPDDLVVIKARLGEPGQGTRVDMHGVEVVVTGDEAWQHAGIGRVHLSRDQREPRAGNRIHSEIPDYADMRMTGADQHDVLQNGDAAGLHDATSRQLVCGVDSYVVPRELARQAADPQSPPEASREEIDRGRQQNRAGDQHNRRIEPQLGNRRVDVEA